MRSFISILAIGLLLLSCDSSQKKEASDYKNKDVQSVDIGDTVEIYYTTNSCCAYCSPNQGTLEHLEFIGEETVIPYPDDCDGCNRTQALLFVAKSSGSDTILGKIHSHSMDCSDTLIEFESFIVNIR